MFYYCLVLLVVLLLVLLMGCAYRCYCRKQSTSNCCCPSKADLAAVALAQLLGIPGVDGVDGLQGLAGLKGEQGEQGIQGVQGKAGTVLGFTNYYGLTAGTGNGGATDYAATVAVKTAAGTGRVPFPRDGVTTGASTRVDGSSFTLPEIGTYSVSFRVHTTEPGQLQLELDGAALPETTMANMNPTAGGHEIAGVNLLVTTTTINSVLAVINPTGNSPALTITTADGASTHANAQTLTILRLQ